MKLKKEYKKKPFMNNTGGDTIMKSSIGPVKMCDFSFVKRDKRLIRKEDKQ